MSILTNKLNSILALLAITTLLTACNQSNQPAAGASPAMPPMPVSVVKMAPTTVPISAEAVAQTEGAKEVEVRPRVGGIILKKLYQEGQAIKAGQAMFTIDPVPFQIAVSQAKAQLAQLRARVEQTQRESTRLQGLLSTQSISQREYDNAVSEHAIAKANVSQAEAQLREAELNLSYTTVYAPSSGMAGRFLFSEGALVSANSSLLTTIVQISPIWVRFSFSDAELAQLGGRLDEAKTQKVQLVLADGQVYPIDGKLNFAASEIDPNLGTQQLRAVFENPKSELLPGQFVRARIFTGTRSGVYLVPQAAVLTSDQGKFVFVAEKSADGKTIAAVRPIQEGSWQGSDWVVLGGLKTGDQVLVDNLLKVRPGAQIAPHPAGQSPIMPNASKPSASQTKQVS